jgi:formylglycine-generating enzyme required for sulfatase activity
MALKTGEMAGLSVPKETMDRVANFLDSVNAPDGGFGYDRRGNSRSTTAIGLVCRQYLGWRPERPAMLNGVEILKQNSPAANLNDVYYYYYATQVMRHAGGKNWETWNIKMRDWLIQRQDRGQDNAQRDRPMLGSWSPAGDAHGEPGGRLMVTSLALLTLEVYYRHVPLFLTAEAKDADPAVPASPPRFKNGIGMEFVLVPKGKSWLGGGGGKLGTKEVDISCDFYLGRYEVTQEEWHKVMAKSPKGKKGTATVREALRRLPQGNVSWDQAQMFLKRLNALEDDPDWLYRLPREVEWEYACRGGPMADRSESKFDFYLDQPANELLPGQANFDAGKGALRRVGSYRPNRLGLFDMHGNVHELCDDARKGAFRAIRGGGCESKAQFCRAARPFGTEHYNTWPSLGLRVARVPVGKASK